MLYLGPHHSIADGVINAMKEVQKIGGNAMQIFTGPPHSLNLGKIFEASDINLSEIKDFSKKNEIPLFIHAKYLINLSKPLLPKNKIFLVRYVQDLDIAVKMGVQGVVVHYGTASGGMDREDAYKNMALSLILCLDHASKQAKPLLETSSGEGNYIGKTIEGMNTVYKQLPKKYQKRVKFCIDTCHIFVAGYPIDVPGGWTSYMKQFEDVIGKNKVGVIHLNDSATKFDGKTDQHAELQKGYIFKNNPEPLREILLWAEKNNVPCILETHNDFLEQITLARNLISTKLKGGSKENNLIDAFRQLMNFHKALGNIHQFQAYKNVVNKLSQLKSFNNLKNIEGFGAGILGKVDEFMTTGKMQVLEDMKKDKKLVALVELQKVYGIGPKLAQKLISQNIFTVKQLIEEFNSGKVLLTENQQLGLKYFDDLNTRISREDAERMVKYISGKLKSETLMMGGFRLGKKDGKDLDLVVVSEDKEELMERLGKDMKAVLESGSDMVMVLMKFPFMKHVVHVDFRFAPKKLKAFYTLYFGSGENFSRKIRQIAKDKGYTLSDKGFKKEGKFINKEFPEEKDIFEFLNVEYVKPENRL